MKHVIIGGDGFTGRHLATYLLDKGEHVLICDIHKSQLDLYAKAKFLHLDICDASTFTEIKLASDDIVYHLAARQYHEKIPRADRDTYFSAGNVQGTRNVVDWMAEQGCGQLIFLSTDMVYGKPQYLPVDEAHPTQPIGPYGASKKVAEDLCDQFRRAGNRVTIFRPRLIVGPGRLGILKKLFKLIQHDLPVPLIGDGTNQYQMISVFDCVTAMAAAVERGLPNDVFNLGSEAPPRVHDLLRSLIQTVGSRSFLILTPARLLKGILQTLDTIGLTLMYREQFMIADENYLVDIEKAKHELGWVPRYNDEDMMRQAFEEFLAVTGFPR